MTSNMIYIVALGVGFKCPCKIHLNTQSPPLPGSKAPSAHPSNHGSDYAILCAVLFHTLQSRHKAVQNFVDNVKLMAKTFIFTIVSSNGTSEMSGVIMQRLLNRWMVH